MSIVLAVLLQAVAGKVAPLRDADFDLRDVEANAPREQPLDARCARDDGDEGEIIVCAQAIGPAKYRLSDVGADAAEPLLPNAEIGLFGNVRGSANVQSIGKFNSPSAMVTVKVPF